MDVMLLTSFPWSTKILSAFCFVKPKKEHVAIFFIFITYFFIKLHAEENPKTNRFSSNLEDSVLGTYCYFIPPKDWQFADPKLQAPRVQVGFIGKKNTTGFFPSLNLAIEEDVDISLNEYLKIIKNLHEANPNTNWRDLGNFTTHAGTARLTEMDTKAEYGQIRLLQLIFIKDQRAYILTAAASKDDFSLFYKDFENAFYSLTLTTDLLSNISHASKKDCLSSWCDALVKLWQEKKMDFASPELHFNDHDFQKNYWIPFQNNIINECQEMGPYWQMLFLQSIQKKMQKTV